MVRQTRTGLGKPSLAHDPIYQSDACEKEPSHKATKWREAGSVADETVLLLIVCESRQEGRVSAEARHLKKGWGVHSPIGSAKHTEPLELCRMFHGAPVVARFSKAGPAR